MKAGIAIAIGALLLPTLTSGQCRQKTRHEWHDMSTSRQQQWLGCVRQLYEDGIWNQFEQRHASMRAGGHNNLYFLLYHRALLADLEDAMEGVGCSFGLPYFDSGSVYNHLGEDSAWGPLGGTSGCIEDGPLSGLSLASGNCVHRSYDNRPVWAAATIKSSIQGASTYAEFSRSCENGPHAQVHQAVGGCMANLLEAAADPFFFLHHCYVDYLYANWQNMGEGRYEDIGGQDLGAEAVSFDGRYTLGQLADYRSNLCYEYAQPSAIVGGPAPVEEEEPAPEDGGDDEEEEGEDGDEEDEDESEEGEDDDEEEEEDPGELDLAVPEEQLAQDAVIEEPPELSEEVRESFNLDEEAVKSVHADLVEITDRIHEYLQEGSGNVGDLWDIFKDTVNGVQPDGEDNDDEDGASNGQNEPNAQDGSGASAIGVSLAATMVTVVIALL